MTTLGQSPLDNLVEEDRLRPGRWARGFALATDLRHALDERHLEVDERNTASVMAVARRPDEPEHVRTLEEHGTAELVERLEHVWSTRETDAWDRGLLIGLVLGANAQSNLDGDIVKPFSLMTVVRTLLDVARTQPALRRPLLAHS